MHGDIHTLISVTETDSRIDGSPPSAIVISPKSSPISTRATDTAIVPAGLMLTSKPRPMTTQMATAAANRQCRHQRERAILVLPGQSGRAVVDGQQQHDQREEVAVDVRVEPAIG